MSQAFAAAFVEILPDTSKFAAAARTQINTAMAGVAASTGAAAAGVTRNVTRTTKTISQKFNAAGKTIVATGTNIATLGATLNRGLTLPILGAGYAIYSVSKQFETSMQRIVGLVGESQAQVNAWKKDLINLGPKVKRPVTELADALYFVTSSGFSGASAIRVLTESARAATAGLGTTGDIADALTSALNAYGEKTLSAARATDILVAAVKYGKIEADALNTQLGRVIPTASALHISFADMAGVLAVMSRTGLNAARATTSLSSILSTMLKPSAQAREELKKVGLSAKYLRDVAAKPGGIVEVMRILQKAFKGNDEALARVVPNVRAFRGVMNVLAQDSKSVDEVMAGVRNSTGELNRAFAAASDTAQAKYDASISRIQGDLITLGQDVMPAVADVMDRMTTRIHEATKWWSSLSPHTRKVAINMLLFAAVAGPIVSIVSRIVTVTGFLTRGIGLLLWTLKGVGAALGAVFGSTIGIVIVAIAALVIGLIYAYKHSETFRNIVNRALKAVGDAALWLWRNAIIPAWHGIQKAIEVVTPYVQQAMEYISDGFSVVAEAASWMWNHVVQPIWTNMKIAFQIVAKLASVAFGIIEIAFKILSKVISFVWRNVIKPEITAFGNIFKWLGTVLKKVYDYTLKPIFDKLGEYIKKYVVPAFKNGVKALGKAWDKIVDISKKPVKFVVNTVINKGIIDPYNMLAKFFGVHTVSHVTLPRGFSRGGVFDKPTAIVGEGNTSRPEYVIPTDPMHRSRALSLYADLGTKLMASGGVIGKIGDIASLLTPGIDIADVFSGALSKLKSITNTKFGSLVAAMPKAIIKIATKAIEKLVSNLFTPVTGIVSKSATNNRVLGMIMAKAYGWTGAYWNALNALWTGESGWNNMARNPSSGAFGIPQALPPGKMGAAAVAGNAQAQIAWGLKYIRQVYGNPVNAYAKWLSRSPHWYDSGGTLPPGLTLAYNGTGRPETVTPASQMFTVEDMARAVTIGMIAALQQAGPFVEIQPQIDANEFTRAIRFVIKQVLNQSAYQAKTGRR